MYTFDYINSLRNLMTKKGVLVIKYVDRNHKRYQVPIDAYTGILFLQNDQKHLQQMQALGLGLACEVTIAAGDVSLTDDEMTSLLTTVLHTSQTLTYQIMPNVILKFTSGDKEEYGIGVKRVMANCPTVFSLLSILDRPGKVILDITDGDIYEQYREVQYDLIRLSQLIT